MTALLQGKKRLVIADDVEVVDAGRGPVGSKFIRLTFSTNLVHGQLDIYEYDTPEACAATFEVDTEDTFFAGFKTVVPISCEGPDDDEADMYEFQDSPNKNVYAYMKYQQDGTGADYLGCSREDIERIHAWMGALLERKK